MDPSRCGRRGGRGAGVVALRMTILGAGQDAWRIAV